MVGLSVLSRQIVSLDGAILPKWGSSAVDKFLLISVMLSPAMRFSLIVVLAPALMAHHEALYGLTGKAQIAIAQTPPIDSPANGVPLPTILLETKSSGQVGDLVYASVRLDGVNLFDVAAVRTFADEEEQAGTSPLEVRIQRIENRLYTFLKERMNRPEDLETLLVAVNEVNNQLVVQVSNATTTNSVSIVTVTDNDTEIYGLTAPEVGAYYAERIKQGLTRAYQEQQVTYLRRVTSWVVLLAIATVLLTAFFYRLCQRNWRNQRQIQQQLKELTVATALTNDTTLAEDVTDSEAMQLSQRELQQHHNRLRVQFQGLVIIQVMMWLLALSLSLRMFPQTRSLGLLLLNRPIQIGLTWFVIILIRQVNLYVTGRLLVFLLQNGEGESPAKQERLRKRLPTLIDTIRGLMQTLLLIVGIVLTVIFLFGFSRFGVFASAGVVGLAASIVFQSSLQDAIAGAMLLWHDAYAIGDIVGISDSIGQVEKMTLLMTQIRSSDGELVSFRNGNIDSVKNHTKEWARIDLTLDVALDTDIDKALHVMEQVFTSLRQDPRWRSAILEEPDILAIERFAHSGVTLKIRAKTAPMQQWSVSREFFRRIKHRFDEAGIEIGIPQQAVKLQNQQKV